MYERLAMQSLATVEASACRVQGLGFRGYYMQICELQGSKSPNAYPNCWDLKRPRQ